MEPAATCKHTQHIAILPWVQECTDSLETVASSTDVFKCANLGRSTPFYSVSFHNAGRKCGRGGACFMHGSLTWLSNPSRATADWEAQSRCPSLPLNQVRRLQLQQPQFATCKPSLPNAVRWCSPALWAIRVVKCSLMGWSGTPPRLAFSTATHGASAQTARPFDSALKRVRTVEVLTRTNRCVRVCACMSWRDTVLLRTCMSRCVAHHGFATNCFAGSVDWRQLLPHVPVQFGTATATITVRSSPVAFSFALEGMGEQDAAGLDKIKLLLDGAEIGSATAPGGDLGCSDGPVVFTRTGAGTAPTICFPANSVHTFQLEVDTVDGVSHVASYYQAKLTLVKTESCPAER